MICMCRCEVRWLVISVVVRNRKMVIMFCCVLMVNVKCGVMKKKLYVRKYSVVVIIVVLVWLCVVIIIIVMMNIIDRLYRFI